MPGDEIDIKVTTSPDSFVALLGVDQSVKHLKQGNDLEESEIFSKLSDYNIYVTGELWPDFLDSGVFLIRTVNNGGNSLTRSLGGDPSETVKQLDIWSSNIEDKIRKPVNIPKANFKLIVRKEFPETWIWEHFNTNRFV